LTHDLLGHQFEFLQIDFPPIPQQFDNFPINFPSFSASANLISLKYNNKSHLSHENQILIISAIIIWQLIDLPIYNFRMEHSDEPEEHIEFCLLGHLYHRHSIFICCVLCLLGICVRSRYVCERERNKTPKHKSNMPKVHFQPLASMAGVRKWILVPKYMLRLHAIRHLVSSQSAVSKLKHHNVKAIYHMF
jgi:hypothetical protein